MPVTLDTRHSDKPRRGAKGEAATPREAAIAAATDPQEKRGGFIAFGVWFAILSVICVPWLFKASTQPVGMILLAWSALCVTFFVIIAPTRVLGPLRKEPKARVSSKVRAGLKGILGKVAPILAVNEPPAFVDEAAEKPQMRTLPGALVFNEPLWKQMSENEVNALAVRGLAHQRLGHARRLAIIHEFEKLPAPIFRVLVWPIWIYVELLRNIWLQHALKSADRIALLVIRNFGLLLSAIVKEKAANDANMQKLGVQSSDVANWVAQRGHIGMAGDEISTQYKLGRAIHENPPFEKRILSLQEWSATPEYNKAVEDLAKRR